MILVKAKPIFAYGSYNPELKKDIPINQFPENIKLRKGLGLKARVGNQEKEATAYISAIKEKAVTLDFNHLLAGKDLIYDLIVE